ncbi:hypothetical protein C8A00DRAFT_16962 [Chaetomidium leptoderma]|uniref:Fibroin-3 related protein n=1 Tax=Chaetomidium leptoderma TaxID=669021 RepID=A0AAN6VIF3_9PEZI|nr:hypothetical protein C8A00DRAFT_16962 [Chaetomidium leptoderma]
MPAVDVAMERSLRRGFLDLFVASLRPALERRDIAGQITDVRTAFSSWDNCMQVNYCKWPVIALIIIGGLIIISVVWCCCGNCCGCCDPPRGSRAKYLDEPYIPPNHGYKSQEPMHAGFGGPAVPAAAKGPDFPQYAEFDSGGKKNEDALPHMPSWEGAERKQVYLEDDAVEMNALKKPETGGQAGAAAAAMSGMAGAASPNGQRSPVNRSPYGPPGAAGSGSNGFFPASAVDNDPYSQGAPAYNQPGMAYSEPAQGYGMAGAAMGPGRRSPQTYNDGGYNDGYNNTSGHGQTHDYPDPGRQGSYDNYGTAQQQQQPYDNYDNYNAQSNQGYGISRHQTPHDMDVSPYPPDPRRSPAPQQSPGPYGGYAAAESRRSPAPQQGQYGSSAAYGPDPRRSPAPQQGDYNTRRSPGPQAGYGNNQTPYGASRAPPRRQYSSNTNNNSDMSPVAGTGGSNALRNDGGFDFTSGYSRPPAPTATSPVGGGYRQPSPAPEGGYPGYKPYQPA